MQKQHLNLLPSSLFTPSPTAIFIKDMQADPESPTKSNLISKSPSLDSHSTHNRLRSLLLKPNITIREAYTIYDLMKDFELFSEVREFSQTIQSSFMKTLKSLEYRQISQGNTIYREGDLSDGKIYFILSGEVSLENKVASELCKERIATFFESLLSKPEAKREQARSKVLITSATMSSGFEPSKKQPLDQEKLMAKLAESNSLYPSTFLRRGQSERKMTLYEQVELARKDIKGQGAHFGHNFLFPANPYRREEAVAYTDCEVVLLSSEYLAPIRSNFQKKAENNFNFLVNNFPGLFEIDSFDAINMMAGMFEPITVTKGQALTLEGDMGSKFYLIKTGEVEVYKRVKSELGSFHYYESLGYQKEKSKMSKPAPEELKLCLWTTGSFVGEEIIFQDHLKYEYTIRVCSSEAVLYAVDKVKFALRAHEHAFKRLGELHMEKMQKNSALFKEKLRYLIEYLTVISPRFSTTIREKKFYSPNGRNFAMALVSTDQNPTIFTLAQALKQYVENSDESHSKTPKKSIKNSTSYKNLRSTQNILLTPEPKEFSSPRVKKGLHLRQLSQNNFTKFKDVDELQALSPNLNNLNVRKGSQPSLEDILEQGDDDAVPRKEYNPILELKPTKTLSLPTARTNFPMINTPKVSESGKLDGFISVRKLQFSGMNAKRCSVKPLPVKGQPLKFD